MGYLPIPISSGFKGTAIADPNLIRSQWGLPVNWPFIPDQTDMTYLFSEFVLAMSSFQLLEMFDLAY